MPNDTIDTLNIEVSSSTAKAAKALDNLSQKLSGVNKALQSVNTGGLRNYARDMGRVSASIKALNGIKVNIPNLNGLSKQLESLGKVDFSALTGVAQPLKDLSAGLRSLDGLQNISIPKLDAKNINSVVSAAQKLSGVDTAKIPLVSDGIEKLANSMTVLQNVGTVDKGINTTINALNRLFSIDMSNFNPDSFNSIATSIGSLASIPDVSSGLNRFMSSLQKLANAGESIGTVASELPTLGTALRETVNKMASAGNVSDSVNMFTQSIGRLASAGAKTGQTAAGLQNLAEETLKFFQAMTKAPKISKDTIAMTQALAQLASAGGRVGTATGTITSAFNKLSGLATKSANAIKKAASGISSAFQKIGSSSGGLKSASFNLGTLFKTAIGFGAVRGLINFGKSAIDLGSDITEVENVVDVSFGSMAHKAYEFASTATEQFGLSELAAKQYSGTMMAMLNSSGVAQDAAAEMSTTLAGLAGDLASFYNLDTDTAFQKIRAGISGETEPLKALGINMSVANLEAYALANGITKSYQAMSQAEQATLRYNYLMSVTGQQQGDFARTSGKLCAA